MKYFASLMFVSILCFNLLVVGFVFDCNSKIQSGNDFFPQNIVIKDDAYHGGKLLPFTEWWYFDTIFDNGYSAQMSVRIISGFGKGFVFERLDLYKNGTLVIHDSTSYHLREFSASSEIPNVQIQGKTIIFGYCDNTTGDFIYNVSFDFPSSSAELHFVGCTKGWKGQHSSGDWWAVILPRAIVTGTITIDNMTLNVTGTGYHDHNWNVNGRVCFQFGWFWGKFNSNEYSAVWSAVLSTRFTFQPIMVVNKKNEGYIAIPSETICFSAENIQLDHLMFIPYLLNIEINTEAVFLEIYMKVIDVDYDRFMGFMSYWRYHVKCSGTFIVDGYVETVDNVFIAEYIRFR